MTREEKLQKAHQMFDNRNLLIELKWQREYFKRGYVSNQEELFNLWIFDECIKALEKKSKTDVLNKIRAEIEKAVWEDVVVSSDGTDEVRIPRLDPDDVFEILDKYKAESEDKE